MNLTTETSLSFHTHEINSTLKQKGPACLPLILMLLHTSGIYQNLMTVISDRYIPLAKHFSVAENKN